MRRALRFLIVAAVLLGLAWLVGSLPGDVTAHTGGYTIETSVPAALLVLFIIVLLFAGIIRLLGGIRRAPGGFGAWRGGRRARLGEIATQRGLVALAAEDAVTAQAEAARARKLLGDTPLALLLTAEAAQLGGRPEQARAAFQQLTGHKDMAFLGHRGLLRQTLLQGDAAAAGGHAAAAEAAYPNSSWLKSQRLEIAVNRGDWPNALALTRDPAQVAAFAAAAANEAKDDRQAVRFGKQAVNAEPGFAPGVVAYAKALLRAGKPGAAKKVLRSGWSVAPNPMIAAAYLEPEHSPIDRAKTAAELAAARPGDPESELLLAQTALEARLTGEARRHAEAAVAAGATDNRAAAILGALEGNSNTVLPAGASAGWVCTACHAETQEWRPICPHCHKPGTLSWLGSRALLA